MSFRISRFLLDYTQPKGHESEHSLYLSQLRNLRASTRERDLYEPVLSAHSLKSTSTFPLFYTFNIMFSRTVTVE